MLLTVLVQNSEITFGVFGDDGDDDQREYWSISTNPSRTPDELSLVVYQLLRSAGLYPDDMHGVSVASAVPDVTAAIRRVAQDRLEIDPVIVGPGVRTGLPILYDNPKEAGADRIAAAVGALDRYGSPVIVVGFGTAVTFDCVDSQGRYAGGAIAPGVVVALDALVEKSAGLHRVELRSPRAVVARTTSESIQSGVVFGTTEMVDGMCRRIQHDIGSGAVIATGALAELITEHSEMITANDPWVALWGLKRIWEKNQ